MSTVFSVNMGMGANARMNLDFKFNRFVNILQSDALEKIRIHLETGAFRGANILKDKVREFYEKGIPGHIELHPFTIKNKGHGQPLFESGELARSVRVLVIPKGRDRTDFTVTVAPGKQSIKASIAEHGAVLPVTPKMRRFLAARGLILRKSTKFITVPPRPVFQRAVELSIPAIEREIIKQMEIGFGKVFGRF